MKRSRLLLACLVPLALSACGIPDIVAHGVKEFDKSQRKGGGEVQPAAAPARPQRAEPAIVQEEPPPVYSGPSAPASRESISVEALPPPK